MSIRLRHATLADARQLRAWEGQAHLVASGIDGDWQFEAEIARASPFMEHLIAELDGRAIGYVQVCDPAREESHYWGDVPAGLRALDVFIGDPALLGQGHGTEIMRQAIARCFAADEVTAIVIDPLASNARAIRFYERLGFMPVERRRFGEDDCLVMRLDRPAP